MKTLRKIVKIDEEKCNGCGQCIPSCVEGALQVIDGKARLVKDTYCDGLGACLGECPQDAIAIEERVADEFDEEAVEQHLVEQAAREAAEAPAAGAAHVCPGTAAFALGRACAEGPPAASGEGQPAASGLRNWPLQFELVPPQAPYFQGADLLIAADCVPFALPDFHPRFLNGRVLMIGCPKLGEARFYQQKLAEIFGTNDIQSVSVLHMEVPCCFGLAHLVESALADSGKQIPLTLTKVGIRGDVVETRELGVQEVEVHG